MTDRFVLLHLSLIDGIGPAIIQKINTYTSAHVEWADVYDLSCSDFQNLYGLTRMQAEKLVVGLKDTAALDCEIALLETYPDLQMVTFLDDAYPALLKQIHVPPSVLYWSGAPLDGMRKKIAVVGSRKADEYGQRMVNRMVPEWVAHDMVIVSGGALGIDGIAHQATLDAGGKTVVVLGSGLRKPSPQSHRKLFDRVVAGGGTLVSMFPLETAPQPHNFPARNRVISGLSDGVVVMQAAEKSGARITAQYALEQGRDVFAVPGSIDNPLSVGCHRLIQEGAQVLACAGDLLAEYGITQDEQKTIFDHTSKSVHTKYSDDSIESAIRRLCSKAHSIDELALKAKCDIAQIQTALFTLQLDGVVQQDFTGLWRMII